MGTIAQQIFDVAQALAARTPGFQLRRIPGNKGGNGVTTAFLKSLDEEVRHRWNDKVRLQEPVLSGTKYSFDYFIPSEQTAVEISLGIRNPVSEFEKDIFKAILAKDAGKRLRRVVLIGKEGSVKCRKPAGPRAIMRWARQECSVEVEVKELISNGGAGQ